MSGHPPVLADALEELAARLDSERGPVVLVADDLQIHPDALADLTEDPRPSTTVLVSAVEGSDVRGPARVSPVRLRGGRVVSAGSAEHRVAAADAVSTGAVRVADADRVAAAAAAREASVLASRLGWAGDPVDHLVVALVRGGATVGAVSVDPWPWRRGATGQDRAAFQDRLDAIGAGESHRIRLARASKADDGLVASLVSRPVSRRLTPLALRWGLTPNQVTVASFAVGLAAAACFALGDRAALVAGAVLLQLSLAVDCVDGDVARYTRRFSATGAWLDASTDRLKEFACYGGLAWGSDAGWEAWLVAAAMLTVQTTRHTIDYTFTAVKDLRESEPRGQLLPLEQADDALVTTGTASARAVRASERSNRRPAVRWAKKGLHLGIGERWMVLSVFAALGRPVLALATLVVLGLVSFAYTTAGRTLRTRSWPPGDPSAREREVVAAQADGGPLQPQAAALVVAARPGGGRFLWARPAALRAVEYAAVLGIVTVADRDALDTTYLLLLVVASHHYDDLYRVLHRLTPATAATRLAGLGAPGRLLVVTLLALAGSAVLEGGLWVLAAALGILYVVVEPVRVLREVRVTRSADPVPEAAGG